MYTQEMYGYGLSQQVRKCKRHFLLWKNLKNFSAHDQFSLAVWLTCPV